jgi:hydroxymethylpyrimidine pyrophosphatase-like HAD family hydrolase
VGRKYQEELAELIATSAGSSVQWKQLTRAVAASSGVPLIIVASGGAQIAARWMARLHLTVFGHAAIVITPLEALSLTVPQDAAIWLVSQGGSHPDILAAAAWAIDSVPLHVFGLVGRDDTPLVRRIDEAGGLGCSLGTPAGADGFLSTNGLWAMLCALTKVYRHRVYADAEGDLPAEAILAWARAAASEVPVSALREHISVVGDPWTLIGADDLQVRSTEASLASLWITDLRNLGHGRHFWFADRASETTCVFLSSPTYMPLKDWTKDGLPPELKIVEIAVPFEGMLAGLAAVAWSIYLADRLGQKRGRDPGRPGVPAFGERLYGGNFDYRVKRVSVSPAEIGVAKKLGVPAERVRALTKPEVFDYWLAAWLDFRDQLHNRTFKAIVLDFDGTLVYSQHRWGEIPAPVAAGLRRIIEHGAYLGIATGRGDSVQPVLQRALEGCDISRVVVGYHNGAALRGLADDALDMDKPCKAEPLIAAYLRLGLHLGHAADLSLRRYQCTLRPRARASLRTLWQQVRALLNEDAATASLAVWLSSHSIDVCAPGASKHNVIDHIAQKLSCNAEAILRLGDRGGWPGNDFELLDHPSGLSVDECSSDPRHCWNLTTNGSAGPAGVAEVLARARLEEMPGAFHLDMEDDQ